MKTFGLVLSGGGVRALAHAGMLKALEEHDLHPALISGTLCLWEDPRATHRLLQKNASV